MRPIVFNGTTGWLNDVDGRRGVVIAGSHGFEDLCSRRFLKQMADRIAGRGMPVLQFDYPGCGDAAGDHTMPDGVTAWTGSIDNAIDRLKAETGVEDVVLIGFRLGALLSIPVASRRADIAALALLAPPASGRAFVRELTALSRMIDGVLPEPPVSEVFDGLQVAGFRLSSETVNDLRALDPFKLASADVLPMQILVMGREDASASNKLATQLRHEGGAVTVDAFGGYNKLMCDPTANEIPVEVIERCANWVADQSGGARNAVEAGDRPRLLDGHGYEEEPVVIGPAPHIAGVLCRPRRVKAEGEAFVFLNAGAVSHVGWARGTVEIARALAAEGIASLRIDLPDIGLSEAPNEERIFLYDMKTRDDVVRVIDWMNAAGYERVGLAGTCSGAFQAFHAARVDPRVANLMMINPLCFAWNASYALEMTVWKTYENSKVAFGQSKADVAQVGSRGPLAGIRSLASFMTRRSIRRGLEIIKSSLVWLSPVTLLSGNPVERWMRDLTARGTRVMMVTCEGDLSLEEIDRHFGPDAERLRRMPGVTMHMIPAADHTLTPVHARRALIDYLIELGRAGQQAGPAERRTSSRGGTIRRLGPRRRVARA